MEDVALPNLTTVKGLREALVVAGRRRSRDGGDANRGFAY